MRVWLVLYLFCLQIACIGAIEDTYEVEIDALLSEESNYDDILELSDAGFADDEMDENEKGEEISMENDLMDEGTPPPMIAHLPIQEEESKDPVSLVELLSNDKTHDSFPVQKYDGYGECTDVFVRGKKRIKLFVYIDICPDRAQCDVIRDWSGSLVEYILSKYSVHCNVQFILAKNCKSKFLHPFRDAILLEDEYYGSFDDEKTKKSDKLFPDLPSDSKDYNFAINFFRGGKGKGAYAKHIIDVEKKSHISHVFNFYICRNERGCLPAKHSIGKDRWLQSLVKIVAYSRLRIVGTFVCDTVSRAVPIEFYVGKKHKCICRCPAGYERRPVNGKPCCVKKVKKCKCAWIKKCFKYRIKEEWNNKVCKLRNWYDIKAITPIPLPLDNYVGFHKNKYDKSVAKTGPRIELQIGDTTTSYTWRYFQRNRKEIFNNIELFSVGRYKIILRAFDYGPDPVVCWTWLVVTDENRPSSKKPCPEDDVFGKGEENARTAVYSKANFEKAIAIAVSFKKWIIHRQNDQCTADWNVDPECLKRKNRYTRWTFYADRPRKTELPTFEAPKKCFRIFKDDTDWMKAHVTKELITSEIVGRPKYCKKCCKLYHQFSEWYIPFRCKKRIPGKECCPGDKCDLKQCLQGNGKTFFQSKIEIKEKFKRKTEEIIQHLSDNGYNSDNEIHFELPESCTAYGSGASAGRQTLTAFAPPSCQIEKKIKALFDEKREYISKYFETEIFSNFNVKKLIKWRYKIDDGSWANYHTHGPEIFQKLKTEIILEAWSACGRICRFVFHVYVHLHADVDVCEAFAEDSFYQSTRYHTQGGIDNRFCNHPESDFGELTFDFNPAAKFDDFGAKHHLKFFFVKMKCWAKFGTPGSYTSKVNVADWSMPQRFLKRYAIVLAAQPTTREDTPVHWECKFVYTNYKGQKRSRSCQHEFTYCDCEGPGWDCAWGECRKNCTNPKEKRPNQACGGTQLIWNQKKNKAVRDDTLHDCCQDCGQGAVCTSVFPGVYDNTICSCRVVGKDPTV